MAEMKKPFSPHSGRAPSASKESQDDLAECHGEPISGLERPLWSLFTQAADAYAKNDALVSLWQHDISTAEDAADTSRLAVQPKNCLRWTFAELRQRSEAAASWLRDRGCRSGMHLVVVLWNSAEWALFFWAAAKIGMVFVPLDPRLVASDARHFLTAARPAVIVVQDAEGEKGIQDSTILDTLEGNAAAIIRISCSSDTPAAPGWVASRALFNDCGTVAESGVAARENLNLPRGASNESAPEEEKTKDKEPMPAGDQPALIVFTSGTTSMPKGCVHTAANLWAQTYAWDPNPPDQIDSWLVHTPVSHIFAVNNALRAWREGDAVVFASQSFDIAASLRALVDEKCTHMSAVPAIVEAILAHPAYPGKDALRLRYVTLGSTLISRADIERCKVELGAVDAMQAFGMSEGAPLVGWARKDALLEEEKEFHAGGVGKVVPGANMRICAPGTRRVLKRGQSGELHVGGACVISRYLDGAESESFYSDHVGNWLVTGDQGLIDKHGVLHLLGRRKDMIIRSGENIAPVKIESAIREIPGVVAQVVGVPDDVAGQIPVAVVVKFPDGLSKEDIGAKVNMSLGPQHALGAVYTLEELGLRAFPSTVTGKIRKEELRKIVLTHRTRAAESIGLSSKNVVFRERLLHDLLTIWEELIGFRPSPQALIRTFADSITLLRYCHRFLRAFGQRLTLQDFISTPTVENLVELVEARAGKPRVENRPILSESTSLDLGFLGLDATATTALGAGHERYGSHAHIQSEATKTSPRLILSGQGRKEDSDDKTGSDIGTPREALDALGLTLEDLDGTLPIKDYYQELIRGARSQSYRHRVFFAVQPHVGGASKVREALQIALASHPILRTIIVQLSGGTLAHIILKPNARVFRLMIRESVVDRNEDAARLGAADDAVFFDASLTTQASIFTAAATADVFLSITYSHTVFDMMSVNAFHADFDLFLSAQNEQTGQRPVVPQLVSYANFVEAYEKYKGSALAQATVDFHVGRLRGISRFRGAFWPPARAPGWMIGTDASSPHAYERSVARQQVWKGAVDEPWTLYGPTPRISRVISLPDMPRLRDMQPPTDPQTAVKTALAVFNVIKTGQPYAIFNTVEAARSWPFMLDWMAQRLPSAMLIDGPTVDWVLRMVQIDLSSRSGTDDEAVETVAQLLGRMAREQTDVEMNAHVPWYQVLERLGAEEAGAATDASHRQSFVWDMSLRLLDETRGSDYRTITVNNRYDWPDSGVCWNCYMLDETRLMIVAAWDTAQMSHTEMVQNIGSFANTVVKLVAVENWDRPLRDVFLDK